MWIYTYTGMPPAVICYYIIIGSFKKKCLCFSTGGRVIEAARGAKRPRGRWWIYWMQQHDLNKSCTEITWPHPWEKSHSHHAHHTGTTKAPAVLKCPGRVLVIGKYMNTLGAHFCVCCRWWAAQWLLGSVIIWCACSTTSRQLSGKPERILTEEIWYFCGTILQAHRPYAFQ